MILDRSTYHEGESDKSAKEDFVLRCWVGWPCRPPYLALFFFGEPIGFHRCVVRPVVDFEVVI